MQHGTPAPRQRQLVDENNMVQLYKMAKATVTGAPPRELGGHKALKIS